MEEQNQQGQIKKTPFTEGKKLVDENLMHADIAQNTQSMINTPMDDDTGVDPKDREFIEHVLKLINDKTIDLYNPNTLINKPVYEKLDYKAQGIADINGVSLLAALRQIKKLYDHGYDKTYQIQNLINQCRLTKERLENECGDIYII
ncbi:hypothetical protein JW911_04110 [Candidatus Peregrinibacteria bacterium]|nr:hypothetical protein [Candidatus Peregrinibacteria bacterium]